MCGIVGYIGNGYAADVLLGGLRDLEYRGYDSAGMKLHGVPVLRAVGPVANLYAKHDGKNDAHVGIAHTRWATHGLPNEQNAHPHSGEKGIVWLVHNGIIENHAELKAMLLAEGVTFSSDTDTEVLAQLIEREFLRVRSLDLAVEETLKQVRGAYAIVVFSEEEPDRLVAARMGSPLVLGVHDKQYFVASDIAPIVKHTRDVVYLEDGEIVTITADGHAIRNGSTQLVERKVVQIDWDIEEAQKSGYEHFMLKEIFESPDVIRNTMRGRVNKDAGTVELKGLASIAQQLRTAEHIHIVGCGSAYYAGLYGKYILEEYAGVTVDVDYASEFRYRNAALRKNAVVLAISQSGETADTLEAIRRAKKQGILTLGIVNVVGSTIARETTAGIYNHAGPEMSVASTKAFISQMVALVLVAIYLGRMRSLSADDARTVLTALETLPAHAEQTLANAEQVKISAARYAHYTNFLFLGRKYNFPIALEGALKLKEVSYIHAEGYGAGEMKHGPLAMIDETFPTLAIAPHDSMYEKVLSNIAEVKARNGRVLVVSDADQGDDTMLIPAVPEPLQSIVALIPLQLFAYYAAVLRGLNVDRPRNLAKSVTVE